MPLAGRSDMLNRSYSGVVIALTYGQVLGFVPTQRKLASALDDLGAFDVYADEDCPETERCPESPYGTPPRPIVVVEVNA